VDLAVDLVATPWLEVPGLFSSSALSSGGMSLVGGELEQHVFKSSISAFLLVASKVFSSALDYK
jgi:hypothetical protein